MLYFLTLCSIGFGFCVCIYVCVFLVYFFKFLFVCFYLLICFLEREKEGLELDGMESGEDLGGDRKGKPCSEYTV